MVHGGIRPTSRTTLVPFCTGRSAQSMGHGAWSMVGFVQHPERPSSLLAQGSGHSFKKLGFVSLVQTRGQGEWENGRKGERVKG